MALHPRAVAHAHAFGALSADPPSHRDEYFARASIALCGFGGF